MTVDLLIERFEMSVYYYYIIISYHVFIVLLFIRALFMYCKFALLYVMSFGCFWFSFHCLPSDWLERLLSKPNRGDRIIFIKPRPKIVYDFLMNFLVCCIVSLLSCMSSPK